jgi:hypothetical protein
VDFYGDVLLELVTALGAALFLGNVWALIRRRADRRDAAKQAAVRARPGSPVRAQVRVATTGNLEQAPLARSLGFMVVGFLVFIWGIASIVSG